MNVIHAFFLCGLPFVCACTAAQSPADAQSDARGSSAAARTPERTQAAGERVPLGEFEPLTQADVDLYLKVMRAAAERVKNLPAADREALGTFRRMGTRPNQLPSAEDMAALQRAGELIALDSVVARELGVAKRYASISSRAAAFTAPQIDASGDGNERMTAEQKRDLKVRIERFRQRRTQDAATLAPHREEILLLQNQVNVLQHPEGIPR